MIEGASCVGGDGAAGFEECTRLWRTGSVIAVQSVMILLEHGLTPSPRAGGALGDGMKNWGSSNNARRAEAASVQLDIEW